MSLKEEIQSAAYDALKEQKSCTLEDIKNAVKKRGIKIGDESAAIRVAMSKMAKNDPAVRRIERGCYAYDPGDGNKEKNEYETGSTKEVTKEMTGGIEKQLMQDVEAIRTFNWIKGTDEEVEAMRKKIKDLEQVYLMLDELFR